MSLKTKKSNEPILRKSNFKFPTYLTMTRNLSKSLKRVCERGIGLTNDTNNFSFPCPLYEKKCPYFFDRYSHFTEKRKKLISHMLVRKFIFPLSHGNDYSYQKSKDIFFLKGGMGKKSYQCHLSIQALFHMLSLVILVQFLAIVR